MRAANIVRAGVSATKPLSNSAYGGSATCQSTTYHEFNNFPLPSIAARGMW